MALVSEHTTVIAGKVYTTKTFPASQGLVLLPKLIQLLGENLIALFFAASGEALDSLLENPEVISKAILTAARNADEVEGGWNILRDLLRFTRCDKVKIGDVEVEASLFDHFDDHFTGDYGLLIQVAMWAAQVSFVRP